MVSFSELLDSAGTLYNDAYLRLPQIARDMVRILWAADWYDGPRRGMRLYAGEHHWFEICAEELAEDTDDPDRDYRLIQGRRCILIVLSPLQVATEEHWHNLFKLKVGTHCDYDESGRRGSLIHPQERWREYFDAARGKESLNFSTLAKNPVVGWFEW